MLRFTQILPLPVLHTYVREVSRNLFVANKVSSARLFICSVFIHLKTTFMCAINQILLKDKSGDDNIIVKKQLYQQLNTSREFFPSSDASNFHKLVNE